MDLEKGKTLTEFSDYLIKNKFQDVTDVIKPKIKNVRILETINSQGVATTYELYYLKDGRIYELVMSIDSDRETKYGVGVKMAVQRIAFNKVSNKIHEELGSTTISVMDWEEPYSQEDWLKDDRAAAALAENKLFIFFGYVSDKYKGTSMEDEPSVYITMDPFLRVRIGVKDIELAKLLPKN